VKCRNRSRRVVASTAREGKRVFQATRLVTCLAALSLWVSATLLGAQSVRGTVVRPGDSSPLAGVVVLLVDGRDSVVARALTNQRGEYRIAAPAAGAYRERTLRIGYRPHTSEPFRLGGDVEIVHRLALENVAFAMDTVRVVSANTCRVRTDTAASTYAIWEQVRIALTATQITSDDRAYGARVVPYERTLYADGRHIVAQQSALDRNFSARPWLARPVEELRPDFTFTDSTTPLRISVPDARQLLTTMCGAAVDAKHGLVTGRVTMRGDTVPPSGLGVVGEWAESGSDAAATLDTPSRSAGARTDQRGRFLICGIPLRQSDVLRVVNDSIGSEPVTLRIGDGQIGRADFVGERVESVAAVLTGVVVADSTNLPLADVDVLLSDINRHDRTNARGTFRLTGVPPGVHTLSARRVGYGPLDARVEFTARHSTDKGIALSRVTSLDSVRVVAARTTLGVGLAAFEESRAMGLGKFVTPEQMRANEHRKVVDMLRVSTGLRILTRSDCKVIRSDICKPLSPTARYAVSTRISHIYPCFLEDWLDGAKLSRGGDTDWRNA
jgi:hypothetical protein